MKISTLKNGLLTLFRPLNDVKAIWSGWELNEPTREICSAMRYHWANIHLETILRKWRKGRGFDKETLHDFAVHATLAFDYVTAIVYTNEVVDDV